MAEPIGFIGLGMMGLPMVRSLLRRGFVVIAYDRSPAAYNALDDQRAAGRVAFADQPRQVADRTQTIILMLPDSRAVSEVMEGAEGLLPGLGPGHLVIDMGSSEPAETRRLAACAATRGAQFVDAPVSGSVVKARAGTLTIMLGGDDAVGARAAPILAALGEIILRTGPVGSAHAMKALNNFVYAAGLLACAEALAIAAALRLDPARLVEVLNASSGRNVATETKARQEILSGRYEGGFRLALMHKDLETAGRVAAESGMMAGLLDHCRQVWRQALAALGEEADNTAIHRFLTRTHQAAAEKEGCGTTGAGV